jgi:hypothetical protein
VKIFIEKRSPRKIIRQSGLAFAYILAILTLAIALATAFSRLNRGTAQAQSNQVNYSKLLDQISLIRNRIVLCTISYPSGDNGSGSRISYPSTPASKLVSDLTCPGQSGFNNLWVGTGGLTLPSPPIAYGPWMYANDAVSMRITITGVVAGDPIMRGILDRVVVQIGSSASRSGDILSIIITK